MNNLARGQKVRLPDLTASARVTLGVALAAPSGLAFDISCFGVDAQDKLSDDRYFIFFNQKQSPCGAIKASGAGNGCAERFEVDFTKLPASIKKLVFTVTADGAHDMSAVGDCALRVSDGSKDVACFNFRGSDFKQEKAVILAEVYQKDVWRLGAVGQGFNGGLSALLKHFGGEEAAPAAVPPPKAVPPPMPAPPPMPKAPPSKITLTKPGQQHRITLEKGGAAPRKLLVKAVWTDNGDNRDDNDDLDLRVGLLLPDGSMKFIQAPDTPGNFDGLPFVRHLGDVTSASAKQPGVETVEVNPEISQRLGGRVAIVFSVYSAVSNGAVSVASLKPIMRMEYGDQVVECAFDFRTSKAANDDSVYTYVIGVAQFDGSAVTLEPSGATSYPGTEFTPWLTWGKGGGLALSMDGPVVFKGGGKAAAAAAAINLHNPRRYS
jgi:tellurite resistance protein TerA